MKDFACDWEDDGYPEKCEQECEWCKKWNNENTENMKDVTGGGNITPPKTDVIHD